MIMGIGWIMIMQGMDIDGFFDNDDSELDNRGSECSGRRLAINLSMAEVLIMMT
jgi:hypothetical protein